MRGDWPRRDGTDKSKDRFRLGADLRVRLTNERCCRDPTLIGSGPPLAIGASRVYPDVHWATDVLGGWSVGALVAALGAVVYERVRRNTREHGRPAR